MDYIDRDISYADWSTQLTTAANTVAANTVETTEVFRIALDELRKFSITGWELAPYEPDITIESNNLNVIQQYPITIDTQSWEDMWDVEWIGSIEEKEKEPADEHELDEFLDSIVKKGVDIV